MKLTHLLPLVIGYSLSVSMMKLAYDAQYTSSYTKPWRLSLNSRKREWPITESTDPSKLPFCTLSHCLRTHRLNWAWPRDWDKGGGIYDFNRGENVLSFKPNNLSKHRPTRAPAHLPGHQLICIGTSASCFDANETAFWMPLRSPSPLAGDMPSRQHYRLLVFCIGQVQLSEPLSLFKSPQQQLGQGVQPWSVL